MTEAYSLTQQTDKVSLMPHEIENNIKNTVKKYIIKNFEKTVLQNGSYVVKVIDVDKSCVMNGLINELNGSVCFTVDYSVLVFDPVIGSVFNVIVTKFNDIGLWSFPELCPNSCIECISSINMILCDKKKIKIGSVLRFKTLNKKSEFNKITVFGTIIQ
jgi:DNA-directed RNA polymerase subunit E'/Rpb7